LLLEGVGEGELMRFGMVVGAGGERAVSWEIGVLAGLADAGMDPRHASIVQGTSAGALLGARFLLGEDPRDHADRLVGRGSPPDPAVPPEVHRALQRLTAAWTATQGMHMDERRRVIGEGAQVAHTIEPQHWLADAERRLPGNPPWPAQLRVVATDAASGKLAVLHADDEVPLATAIAAARAIPYLLPPIPAGGRVLMDAALGSATHAALLDADSLDLVIVVSAARSPAMGGPIDAEWASSAQAEVAQLRAAGVEVLLISADDDASESMGDELLLCGDLRRSVSLGRRAATTAVDTT
jgi:NTE family protein